MLVQKAFKEAPDFVIKLSYYTSHYCPTMVLLVMFEHFSSTPTKAGSNYKYNSERLCANFIEIP